MFISYTDYLKNILKDSKVNLVCDHKAESKYALVAAASILAKVTRDKEIAEIQNVLYEALKN